jgi:hypothetical protein
MSTDVTLPRATLLSLLGGAPASVAAPETPAVENRALKRREFCERKGISLSTYQKLQREGNGPKETWYPGVKGPRITPEAEAEWDQHIAEYQKSKEAKLEAERRTALAKHAGEKAKESEKHVSKRQRS